MREQLLQPLTIVLVASVGNTLGGVISFKMGQWLRAGFKRYAHSWYKGLVDRFQFNQKTADRVNKYGCYSLLLSWMPIIGDPICVAAGYLQLPFWRSILMIAIGKTVRYIVLIFVINRIFL